ncbi:MAG: RDD family protein [Gammaproteobacteria bacterium]|nr:RDD family protein [Gammaproteobacteria bacterium]
MNSENTQPDSKESINAHTDESSYPRAGLPRRLAALLYDGFLVFAMWMFIGYAMLGIFGTDSNQVVEGVVQTDSVVSTLTFLLMVASSSGFYLWFWTRGGQTLGMISWRLKAVSFDDRPMSVRQGIIRFFSAWPAFWLAGIGYFWLYLDKNNDALHDKLSETKVILMPKGHKPFEKKTP